MIVMEASPLKKESDWSSFVALEDNKKDIALLLSNYLIEHSPSEKKRWLLIYLLKRLLSIRPTKFWICQDLKLTTRKRTHTGFCIVFMLSLNQRWCQYVIQMSLSYSWRTMTKWDVYLYSCEQEHLNNLDISHCMKFGDYISIPCHHWV